MAYYQAPLSSKNQIRILKLFPSLEEHDYVCCELQIVSLNDNPAYNALSYCWSDPQHRNHEVISLNGQTLWITGSLHVALTHLRDSHEITFWWVDALCINQRDVEERSLQVLQMASIYRTATVVIAWIGSNTPGEMELQQQIHSAPSGSSRDESAVMPGLAHFRNILLRQYWRRIWIVQEIAVATDVWVVCGHSRVKWQDLCDALSQSLSSESYYPEQSVEKDRHVCAESIKGFESIKTLRNLRSSVRLQIPLSFMDALKNTNTFKATDNRDKFYALLGLAYDSRLYIPIPDYAISFEDLQVQIARNLLQSTRNLDIIVAGTLTPSRGPDLPSWVPNWAEIGAEAHYALIRKPQQRYRASRGLSFDRSVHRHGYFHLSVEAIFLQRIDGVSTIYGDIPLDISLGTKPSVKIKPTRDSPKLFRSFLYWKREETKYARNIRHLQCCLLNGPSLDFSRANREQYGEEGWMLLRLYYGTTSFQESRVRRFINCWKGAREFDSPELSTWLHINRNFVIGTHTLEHICRHPFKGNRYGSSTIDIYFGVFSMCIIVLSLLVAIDEPVSFEIIWIYVLSCISMVWPLLGVLCLLSFTQSTQLRMKRPFFLAQNDISSLLAIPILLPLAKYGPAMAISQYRSSRKGQKLQAEFLKKMDTHMKKRRLRLATIGCGIDDNSDLAGLPVLVPGATEHCDHIVILKGCSVPVVLREYEDGYHVIGMAYLEDAMWGEMVDDSPTQKWVSCKLY